MPKNTADPPPLPALRLCFKTDLVTLEDPTLYATVQECLHIIGIRQRDFARSLSVTITDIATDAVVYRTCYERTDPPLDLPWLFT